MTRVPRLAVIATHPIQYYAPVFRRLAARGEVELHVFYGWKGATRPALDRGFGQTVEWDIPLLDGYAHSFVPNRSADPGTHHFGGIDCPTLVPAVRAWAPDAVLVYGWAFRGHLAALRAFQGRVPVFFRGDSTLLDERAGMRRLARRALLTWVYRHVDVALYVGTHNHAYYRKHGLREEQLAWAPHSVDNQRFADPDGGAEGAAAAWRAELGIGPDAPTILFAGKLEPKKRPDLLLRAFDAVGGTGAHLIFAGAGPMERELRARAGPRVHFLGFQNQSRMPAVYRMGDVLVLPSDGPGESWGLAVNEAMASGRAVVVSDRVGCAPDLVRQRENGFVFAAGDAAALAGTLSPLVADRSVARAMGAASARIIQSWSIDEQASRIEDAVREPLRA